LILFRPFVARVLVVWAIFMQVPVHARAAEAPTAAELNEARERFAEARKLEEAGQFPAALALFQQVAKVKMTPQVRFHIALCLMHTDKPVDALTNFRTAIQEAGSSSPNVVNEAKQHIATLEKQVAIVTVHVHPEAPTPKVLLDERIVPAREPFEAEPGPHRLRFQLAGQTVDERSLNLQKGTRIEVEFTGPRSSDGEARGSTSGGRIASFVAFGIAGASAIGVGTFAFLRADRLATVEASCPMLTGCSRTLEPIVREGKSYASAVNVLIGVGAAATVAGVILFVASPSSSGSRPTQGMNFRVVPVLGRGTGFVVLEGQY
jgi:hypothetical protein